MNNNLQLGIIGLGSMGGGLALQAREKGIDIIGKTRKPKPEIEREGVAVTQDYQTFFDHLASPRLIYLSLPAGKIIDTVLDEIRPFLKKGDILLDGGNSWFRDSISRAERLEKEGIFFLDCGTSGGLTGARNGACFMTGGNEAAYRKAEPILKKLAVSEGVVYTGPSGSGHFVKLVHNGVEFGMLQAIGEGLELLAHHGEFDLDIPGILHNWNHGSVIRSWLTELLAEELKNRSLSEIPDYIEDTGEVNWLIREAIKKEIPVPVITHSVLELFASRRKHSDTHRGIAAMRHQFGGHPYGPDQNIAKKRGSSKVDPS